MKSLAGTDNQDRRTMQCLKTWAQPKSPRALSFYFWLADASGIQNSFRGFLCHLNYQLLSTSSPGFVSRLLTADRYRQKRRIADWDLEELESLLNDAACRTAAETPLCFFIDALDECVSTDVDHVVRVIRVLSLSSESTIKFCVSSRPEQRLLNRLGGLALHKLELHNLTKRDITRYVTDQFESCWQTSVSPTEEQKRDLINQLVQSSEGVFLWAFLVTKKLCDGIEYGDSIDHLQEQLRELPHDMMKLYESMLGKSDAAKGHRKAEAAMYFKFIIDHNTRQTLFHHLSGGPLIDCTLTGPHFLIPFYEKHQGKIKSKDPQVILKMIRDRVNFLCAGMATFREGYFQSLEFFHRTAKDFFHEPSGMEILQHCKLTQLESFCMFVDAVTRDGHVGCNSELNAHEAGHMVCWVQDMKESTDSDKIKFLQHVDKAMSRLHAMRDGGVDKSWVYNQAKRRLGDDKVIDYTTLALREGSTELLYRFLSTNKSLSRRYKDYVLLCSSSRHLDRELIQKFLELGADPNALFYWGLQDRLKTSPWLQYLVGGWKWGGHNFNVDSINTFLDNGASLDDRTLLLEHVYSYCEKRPPRTVKKNSAPL